MELKVWDNYLFSFLSTSGSGAQEVPIGNNFSDNCSKKSHRYAGVDMRPFFYISFTRRWSIQKQEEISSLSLKHSWRQGPSVGSVYDSSSVVLLLHIVLNILVLLQEDHIYVYWYSVSSRYTTECRSEAYVLEVLTVAKQNCQKKKYK